MGPLFRPSARYSSFRGITGRSKYDSYFPPECIV
jgi:hypothetical protein